MSTTEYPLKRRKKLIVVVPTSTISIAPNLREKTIIVGRIARSLAIFRVDEITLYRDPFSHNNHDEKIFMDILDYLKTPPYLRRKVIPLKKTLRYVGLLQPLQILTTHTVSSKIRKGEIRVGLVVSVRKSNLVIDVGLEKKIIVSLGEKTVNTLKPGDLILVKITNTDPLELEIIREHDYYTGYAVNKVHNLKNYLEELRIRKLLLIATSKYGEYIGNVAGKILDDYRRAQGLVLIFGSPKKGLLDIFPKLGISLNQIDYLVNVVKDQGVKTIRTEEALMITLSIMDYILDQT